VRADKVVISTGAYTEGDWSNLQKQFFRGYYYQVASKPLHGAAADKVLPHGQGSWDTRTVLSSIRRDDQGRLLLGSLGRVDNKPAWFVRSWADRIQSHYYPELGKVEWEMHWTGCIDFTPDHLMRLFEPAPGLVAVTGYNGRGNTTGTVIGRAFAEFLLKGGGQPADSVLADERGECAFAADGVLRVRLLAVPRGAMPESCVVSTGLFAGKPARGQCGLLVQPAEEAAFLDQGRLLQQQRLPALPPEPLQLAQRRLHFATLLQTALHLFLVDPVQHATGQRAELGQRILFVDDPLDPQHLTRPHAPGLQQLVAIAHRGRYHPLPITSR
jgi:hypothetical protein